MLEKINDNFNQIENYKYTSIELLKPINCLYEEITDDFFNDTEKYDDTYNIYLK